MVAGNCVTERVQLKVGSSKLILAPGLGGGIAELSVNNRPVLRPWNGDTENPFSLASNILAPFSNRISDGGFSWKGERFEVAANLEGEACPIHGDAFQKPWRIEASDQQTIHLQLTNGKIGPWKYKASQVFSLSDNGLKVDLELVNTGDLALPFGCGFHPWFPRSTETTLSFEAESVWMEDENHLPTQKKNLKNNPEWSFNSARTLPAGWINNAYSSWQGAAVIDQGSLGISTTITASSNLSTAIVFSPDAEAGFFCFEPVSHPVDAFNVADAPELIELAPGQAVKSWMQMMWSTA